MSQTVIIADKQHTQEERLSYSDLYSSFQYQWEQNQTLQIELTATYSDDYAVAFNLLKNEAQLLFNGQWYTIKQVTPVANTDVLTKQVSAIHSIYDKLKNIRKDDASLGNDDSGQDTSDDSSSDSDDDGNKKPDPNEVDINGQKYDKQAPPQTTGLDKIMHFYCDNNDQGVTWALHGNFPPIAIQVGGNSLYDFLTSDLEQFQAIFFPNNNHLDIYSLDAFKKNTGQEVRYLYNTNNVNIQTDTTDIVNQVEVHGGNLTPKDDDDDGGGGAGHGDDYPAKWKNAPQDSMVDDWGYYNRECVSFAAWRCHQMGVNPSLFSHLGNGNQWAGKATAKGVPVDHTPHPGDIAEFEPGSAAVNHAAYVRSVHGNMVHLENYNSYTNPGHYFEWDLPASSVSHFIHFPHGKKDDDDGGTGSADPDNYVIGKGDGDDDKKKKDDSQDQDKYALNYVYTDQDSVNKYGLHRGEPITCDYIYDKAAMDVYVKNHIKSEPATSITLDYYGLTDDIEGEVKQLIVPELSLNTPVMLTGITKNPFNPHSTTSLEFNNVGTAMRDVTTAMYRDIHKLNNRVNNIDTFGTTAGRFENHFVNITVTNTSAQQIIQNYNGTLEDNHG